MMCTYSLGEAGVATRLEKAVEEALQRGYRTKDTMSDGCTEVGCKKMGEVLLEIISA